MKIAVNLVILLIRSISLNIDLTNDQTTFLLPSYHKYGLKSFDEYETKYHRKSDIRTIGIVVFFDIQGDDVYFVWEGDLKILKINMKSGKLVFFGKKPSHYIKPFATKEMSEARRNRNANFVREEN